APFDNAKLAVTQVHDLLDPSRRDNVNQVSRVLLQATYGLDPTTRGLIGDHTVDVYPAEAAIAWAYGLNWHPLPVFQSYAAYTPFLDHRNAAAVASPSGAQVILRYQPGLGQGGVSTTAGVDGRYAPYDAPATTLAMLCNFRQARASGAFELLVRRTDRCGAPRALEST